MSYSVRPHRRQPTRLPHPWDSPGKNTGVGSHFLLLCMKVKFEREVTQSCPTPSNPMDCSLPGFSVHGIFQARVLEWAAIAFSIFILYIATKFWPEQRTHLVTNLGLNCHEVIHNLYQLTWGEYSYISCRKTKVPEYGILLQTSLVMQSL